jgi:hypothetical protein
MADNYADDKQVKNIGHRWQPGESGNPNGRPPKGHSITETIKSMMDEKPEIKRALGTKLIQMAIDGDIVAIKTVMAYIDGLPTIKHELVGSAGMQVNFLNYVERDTPALAEDNNKR